ncbi:MAG: ATP synthase F0 subunit C [Myxococcales bacterium]|nr:ATP synthase F0 subunit C [Myxococcales bacterium]MCB9520756.1 ATP synthase F0 subunit C [Myxococcales bacterium]MCB9533473.1 ATP synthase F0 subunit C [Myxococcales bacterium]
MNRKNLATFVTFFATMLVSALAFAQDASGAGKGAALFSAAFAISIAAFGGALGQGRAGATALEGIARNPEASGKIFTPMILALALIESLVIYALLIAFQILGKV